MKQQKQLSPENYIKTKARSLPIENCYINENWKESGIASIIIARKHTNGNYTFGIFLVDLFALGTKDSFYAFNKPEEELLQMTTQMSEKKIIKTDYALVHNIIYGANAFAEENGFKICKEFNTTQYILEEDTEDIALIDIEFGKEGEPFLMY